MKLSRRRRLRLRCEMCECTEGPSRHECERNPDEMRMEFGARSGRHDFTVVSTLHMNEI
jgi:hypothetical protein